MMHEKHLDLKRNSYELSMVRQLNLSQAFLYGYVVHKQK